MPKNRSTPFGACFYCPYYISEADFVVKSRYNKDMEKRHLVPKGQARYHKKDNCECCPVEELVMFDDRPLLILRHRKI